MSGTVTGQVSNIMQTFELCCMIEDPWEIGNTYPGQFCESCDCHIWQTNEAIIQDMAELITLTSQLPIN